MSKLIPSLVYEPRYYARKIAARGLPKPSVSETLYGKNGMYELGLTAMGESTMQEWSTKGLDAYDRLNCYW